MNMLRRLIILALLALLGLDLVPRLVLVALVPSEIQPDRPVETMRDGRRRTTLQPDRYVQRILLFGDSTVRGRGVADEDTIASRLQAELPDMRVENYGMDSANLAMQLLVMQDAAIRSSDLVVFYDGVSVLYPRYPFYPACTVPVGLLRLVCSIAGTQYYDASVQQAALADAARWIAAARAYAKSRRACFVHVWQPVAHSQPLSTAEGVIVDAQRLLSRAYLGYDTLPPTTDALAALEALDAPAFDFVHILDAARRAGNGYYLDFAHTTAKANAVIAANLLPIVRKAVARTCAPII
jgi:hypothetical protein